MGAREDEVQSQAYVLDCSFGYMNSMTIKCAVDLRIPDILHTHGHPLTISAIMDFISSTSNVTSPNVNHLSRVMKYLARKQIFSAQPDTETGETLYGLTRYSKWLLSKVMNEPTLVPFVQMHIHPWMMNPCYHMSDSIKDGTQAFVKEHDCSIWDYLSHNPMINQLFNDGMACTSEIMSKAILGDYKEGGGFDGIASLVDVAGGTGALISEIVKANPHGIRGINFDLPHVVANAPEYPGVQHVAGDMFVDIPRADAVIIKWILHDWDDEDCVKILRNCRKAILPADQNSGGGVGKVIIVDFVSRPDGDGDGKFDGLAMPFDAYKMVGLVFGKERTEQDWNKLLIDSGFPRYKIIRIPSFMSIIEGYPE